MQQQQPPSPFATRASAWWLQLTWPERAAYVCCILIVFAFLYWESSHDAAHGHRLDIIDYCIWVVGMFAAAMGFVIPGIGIFRGWRLRTRLREGLCLACGYDLRASEGHCPECGLPFQRPDPGSSSARPLTRWEARIQKVITAFDHWWMHLALVISFGLAALLLKNPWFRVVLAYFALSSLWSLIRRIRKGPSDIERMLRECAR
jgi:hypothetical protein